MKEETKKPTRKNYDSIPAQATLRERVAMMREQARRLRKSPDIRYMWGIRLSNPFTEWYFSTEKKRDWFLRHIRRTYELISPRL